MTSREPVDLDPEVLADPLGQDTPETSETGTDGGSEAALVPTAGALAPFDPFRRYMAELRKYPPLSREEEQELSRHYRETGDKKALFRLVTSNLMLVVRVALSFRRAARNLLDLIQEGNLGLLQAIDRFDPDVGVRLPTYAAWWVRAYMVKFLLDNARLVRVGTTNARRKLLRNLRKERHKLEQMGYEVGPKLLADHFGVSEADVVEVQAALDSHDVALDAPVGPEGRSRAETLPAGEPSAEETVARQEWQARSEAAIERFREGLPERDLVMLNDRLLSEDPLTLQAIGERFGTTREAVRQAEVRLKARLTDYLRQELSDRRSSRDEN
jgi:RNA polymerase sigma-32 factor